jgi:hypothetical protein
MAIIATNSVHIARFANALYATQLGSITNAAVQADITAAGGLDNALNAYYAYSFGSMTTAQVAGTLLTNLGLVAGKNGLTQAAVDNASLYIVGVLNAAVPNARGAAVKALLNQWANISDDANLSATYGAAATAWNGQVTTAQAYTLSNATDISVTTGAVTGQTFLLSKSVDNFNGGAGNDSFVADNTVDSQFSAADNLNGGEGTDSLTIYGTISTNVGNISGIENVTVDSMDAGDSWGFGSVSGIKKLTNARAVGASTVSVADGVAVTLANNAAPTTQTVNFGSTDTTASLTLNKIVGDVTETGAAVTALNIATTGAASTVGTLTTGATVKTVTLTGDQNITVTNALGTAVSKIDGAALTGKLSVVAGNVTDDGTSAVDVTVIGGTASDTLSIVGVTATTETSVAGGAGDDTIKVTAAQIAADAGDAIDGGDGTDTLSVDFLNDATGAGLLATDLSASIKGVEAITLVSDATAPQTHTWAEGTVKSGVTSFTITAAPADSFALTGLKAATTVKVTSSQVAVSAAIGTDTTADVVSFNLDGTTIGTLTATNYETVNIASAKDSSGNTNALTTGTLGAAKNVNLTGAGALTGGAITAAAGATIDASTYTGDLTATTFGATVKSYVGGTGKDEITLVAGDLKQGNSFDGGAGTDKLTVTATAAQDLGILALKGFETVALASDATAADAVVADFRNVTDLTTLKLTTGNAADTFTLNRLSADTTVSFGSATGNVTTTINTGTSQKVAFTGNFAVAALTLDSGTTSLTVTSDDGNATANEAGGSFTGGFSGTSLTTVTVLGNDKVSLGTLSSTVTKVDASAAKGALTVTASATATTVVGSQVADTITGGAAADTITGGKGNDILDGAAGADSYVFEATGAANGQDTLTIAAGAGGDILNLKNFLAGGSVDQNGGAGTALVAYGAAGVNDVNIANKVALYTDAALNGAATSANVSALIQGAGNVFSLTSGGKSVLVTGDAASAADPLQVWFIDDTLDGVSGTVSATDVVCIGISGAGLDLDTLITSNFAFA